jgi:hypothetical protein
MSLKVETISVVRWILVWATSNDAQLDMAAYHGRLYFCLTKSHVPCQMIQSLYKPQDDII